MIVTLSLIYTPRITTVHTKSSHSVMSSLAIAWEQLLTLEIALLSALQLTTNCECRLSGPTGPCYIALAWITQKTQLPVILLQLWCICFCRNVFSVPVPNHGCLFWLRYSTSCHNITIHHAWYNARTEKHIILTVLVQNTHYQCDLTLNLQTEVNLISS